MRPGWAALPALPPGTVRAEGCRSAARDGNAGSREGSAKSRSRGCSVRSLRLGAPSAASSAAEAPSCPVRAARAPASLTTGTAEGFQFPTVERLVPTAELLRREGQKAGATPYAPEGIKETCGIPFPIPALPLSPLSSSPSVAEHSESGSSAVLFAAPSWSAAHQPQVCQCHRSPASRGGIAPSGTALALCCAQPGRCWLHRRPAPTRGGGAQPHALRRAAGGPRRRNGAREAGR